MPAGPVGSSWVSGSWSDTAWEAGTWADASSSPVASVLQWWWMSMWNPYNRGIAITPSDTVNMIPTVVQSGGYPTSEAIYVGGAGVVAAVFQDGTVANFTAAAGEILPIRCIRVNEANTTATLMVALYSV